MSQANGVSDIDTLFDLAPFKVREDTDAEGMGFSTLFFFSGGDSFIPGYWSRQRDSRLVEFSRKSDPLKVAINTFISKATTVPLRINAKDRSVSSHVELAESMRNALLVNSGFMKGFTVEFKKFLFDLLTQDNGAFMLVLGPGPATGPIVGRASGLVHLASYRCTRTSDPVYPVVYQHTDSKKYKLHYTRVITMVNLPNPDPEMRGVGLCPVSLCVDAARELMDITTFVQEKLGSRPQRQILYAKTGATVEQLTGAIQHAEMRLNNENLSRFAKTLLLAPKLAGGKLELDKLDLASVPDGFNRQNDTLLAMATIAAAFGLDLRDLAYSFGISGQTRSDAEMQHKKGLGKGVAEVTAEFSEQLNQRFLPASLSAVFDYMDDTQDQLTAQVSSQRSTARTRDIMGGVLTPRVARQHMLRNGELTESEFEELELTDGRLPDGTSLLSLFYSADPIYTSVLQVNVLEPGDVMANDPASMISTLEKQLRLAWGLMVDMTGEKSRRKVRYAIAALEWIKKLYQEKQMQDEQEKLQAAKDGREGSDRSVVEDGGHK